MNMFKPTKAKTVKEYMLAVPPERKEAMDAMHAFIQKTVPSLKPYFATNMLGYGSFPIKNSKKELIQWPVIALANQKAHITLFVCAVQDGGYLAEAYKKDLGKAVVGKSSISFKKTEDLNLDTLKTVLKAAEKNPGLAALGAGASANKKKTQKNAIKDGSRCTVTGGAHAGKSGTVTDMHTSKTGHVTVTVVQPGGERFKTLAKNVEVRAA